MAFILAAALKNRIAPAESNIFIRTNNEEKQAEFGARLYTYTDRQGDGIPYFRHFLIGLLPGGPAYQMKVKNHDEIILLNDVFVPELAHDDVIHLFYRVNLDRNTPLSLVIQRRTDEKNLEWIKTSAILVHTKIIDYSSAALTETSILPAIYLQQKREQRLIQTEKEHYPTLDHFEYKQLKNDKIEIPKSKHLYRVPGKQKYLHIEDGRAFTDSMKGDRSDRTKVIWKRTEYWLKDSEGHVDYAAALCDVTMTWYIAIDQQHNIDVQQSPFWFEFLKVGDKVLFQFNDEYLGYSGGSKEKSQLKAKVTKCLFEELPAPPNSDKQEFHHIEKKTFSDISVDNQFHCCHTISSLIRAKLAPSLFKF